MMNYFKKYKIFEADENVEEKSEQPKQAEAKALPSIRLNLTFRNTFNYNKTDINESFEKTMNDAISKLDEFMKSENQDNIVEVVQINAKGFASWVPTTYKGGNPILAKDRATSIVTEVKKRVEKYFKDKKISEIQWKNSELSGAVDYKNSQEVFKKFVEENFKSKPDNIIDELKKQNITTVELVKEPSKVKEVEKWQTVNRLSAKQPDLITKISVDDKNAKQIYDLMIQTPLYIRGTSKMKANGTSIETKYREATQYAVVEILVNDPSQVQKEKKEEKPKEEKIVLKSITFDKDVANVDENGKNAINILTNYLQKVDFNKIKSFILIGHAEADDELNKKVFNPKGGEILKDKQGRETNMAEKDLANLRFILSMARCKTVYRAIQNIGSVQKLIEKKSFWMLPAGTLYGNELTNQRIVQVVILTSDNQEINTEKDSVPYGTEFKSNVLSKINQNVIDLGYTFSKLVPKLLSPTTFASPVPDHIELSKNINNLSNFKKDYV